MSGCATNPVTGKQQLMLLSENQEIQIDKKNSPHQFSSDYGKVQDKALNMYINSTGKKMAARTHRTNMPYSFRAVNATYVNAYAFPGGSIAVTRGILLSLDNEAELAAFAERVAKLPETEPRVVRAAPPRQTDNHAKEPVS